MFVPQESFDYTLIGVCNQFVEDFDHLFPSFTRIKGLFIKLNEIHDIVPEGFSKRVLSLLGNQAEKQKRENEIRRLASEYCVVPMTNTSNLPGHQETLSDCFGSESDIGLCMKYISDNNVSERAFVEGVYQNYCKENGKIIQSEIDAVVDEIWRKRRKHKGSLVSKGKVQVDNAYKARLDLMKAWLDSGVDASQFNASAIRKKSTEIIREINKELKSLKDVKPASHPAIVYFALQNIKDRLEFRAALEPHVFFSGILFSGIISMSDDGLPVLMKEMARVKYYEPWRNVLKHILSPKRDIAAVKDGIIIDVDSPIHDNYRQLHMLGKYLKSESDEFEIAAEDKRRTIETADSAETAFKQELEYAYTYDRIGEPEKELLAALLDYKDRFYDLGDFACWKNYCLLFPSSSSKCLQSEGTV